MSYENMLSLFRGTGRLVHFEFFLSAFVSPRHIDIWLPEEYEKSSGRFPVVYIHDGQNIFNPETSYIGIDWGFDQAIKRLSIDENFAPPVVVAIWNTSMRYQEYIPQKPLEEKQNEKMLQNFVNEYGGTPISDRYLKFITKELKPFVDATYRTYSDSRHTFIMGSSVAALVSLYALCEYPKVFGGAACLSGVWGIAEASIIEYLKAQLPKSGTHRVYFDMGTDMIDAENAPFQHEIDRVMESSGYCLGEDWLTKTFVGGDHSEKSWRERVSIPLQFLLAGLEVQDDAGEVNQ
jgi:predicted alpha/beta superfamily hydrolase